MSFGVLARVYACENRHDKKPPAGKLVEADDAITVIASLTGSAETGPQRIGCAGAVQYFPALFIARTLLGIDRDSRIHDLHNVVRTDREAIVGRIAERRCSIRAFKLCSQPVEAFDH